jgi:hypothetical protein
MASRRQFLRKGSLAVFGVPLTAGATLGTIAGATAALRAGEPADTALLAISYVDAAGAVNSTFRAVSATAAASLKLTRVVNLTPTEPKIPLAPWEECFVMQFSASATTVLESGPYKMSHRQLGTFMLTLGPVGQIAGKTRYYEAVINRLPAGA